MSTEETRPKPEHFLTLIRQQQRGRLKIYLGFAAGVGKTYEMLQEGHRLKRQGVDVVIGITPVLGGNRADDEFSARWPTARLIAPPPPSATASAGTSSRTCFQERPKTAR